MYSLTGSVIVQTGFRQVAGRATAAQLVPIVVRPHRFRTKRQFLSYCGLGIVMRSSSDWVRDKNGQWQRAPVQQTRGLNLTHNHHLKAIFKGAATSFGSASVWRSK